MEKTKTALKKAASSTGKFVDRHKVAIAIAGTFVATTFAARWVRDSAIEAHEEFLKEKGLFDEFVQTYFQDPPIDA